MNNKQRLPKIDIMVFKVDYEDLDKTPEAFQLIRKTHATMGYPFGFGAKKLSFHGPFTDNGKFVVYSTIRMNVDQYMRKCANSNSDSLKGTCANWINQYCPDKMSYFNGLVKLYNGIKAQHLQKLVDRKIGL